MTRMMVQTSFAESFMCHSNPEKFFTVLELCIVANIYTPSTLVAKAGGLSGV